MSPRRVAALTLVLVSSQSLVACVFELADVVEPAIGPGGAISSGGDGGTSGGGGVAAGGSDCGGSDAGAPSTEFTEPTPVDLAPSGFNADDPAFSTDLRELYFNSDHDGLPHKIYRSERLCPTDPWGAPAEVTELSIGLESSSPVLSPDGLTMLLAYSLDPTDKQFDIYMATRPSWDAPWSAPEEVAELNSPESDHPDWLSADMLMVGVASVRGGDEDLYVATRATSSDPWQAPVAIAELSTAEADGAGWASPDALTMYFGRYVIDRGVEIYRTTRADVQSTWSAPEPVSELNTASVETDPWLSPDTRYIMFARRVDGTSRLFHAFR